MTILATSAPLHAQEGNWSTAADFAEGRANQVVVSPVGDDLRLQSSLSHHTVLWVVQARFNTIVRIDAASGRILGEYRTAPVGGATGPSQVAIDDAGNAWVGNADEASGGQGAIVKIGVVVGGTRGHRNGDGSFTPDPLGEYLAPPFDYSTAIDRDGDGYIRTSRGVGHRLDWPWGSDASGGEAPQVEQAEDECILLYQRTSGVYVQSVARAANGDIWAGGYDGGPSSFDRLEATSGRIVSTVQPGCGGSASVVGNGDVLWSIDHVSGDLLRFDAGNGLMACLSAPSAQDLATDAAGNVWLALGPQNAVLKLHPDGSVAPGFPRASGGGQSRGIAIGPDGDIWVVHASTGNVTRLDSEGGLKASIRTGSGPFGIDVAADGHVWVTHSNHHNVVRIDPDAGADGLGAVDLAVALASRAEPEHRGDMLGDVEVERFAAVGTWSVVFDGQRRDIDWGRIAWEGDEPTGTRLHVRVRAADAADDLPGRDWTSVVNGSDFSGSGIRGQHLEIEVGFEADAGSRTTPVLHALHLQADDNTPPDASAAMPSQETLWPPNHRLVPVTIQGLTDAEGDAVTYRITHITQDEPVERGPQDSAIYDARGLQGSVAWLRAERLGDDEGSATAARAANGRVYEIHFVATDAAGAETPGSVRVCVPLSRGRDQGCIDDGQDFESTGSLFGGREVEVELYPNPFNPMTTIRFDLQRATHVELVIYDARGRRVCTLVDAPQSPGTHQVVWNGRDAQGLPAASGWYVYQLQTEDSRATGRMLMLK